MITIKEIAKQANVSIATVDRVLHKRGRVSKETREKIRQIIKHSGYKPNIFASNLKLSKKYKLGVLMPDISQGSNYWKITAMGIKKAENELNHYEVFEKNKNLLGIFVTNVFAHFVAEYLKNNIPDKKIYLIGYDLVKENISYLDEDIIDFLINQKAEEQGYKGIYTLYRKLVLHENGIKEIIMPIDIVTKENAMYYYENIKEENHE